MDFSRGVVCMWRVVCGERGRGTEKCWGWSVGDAEDGPAAVESEGDCARDEASKDAGMIRGMSSVRECGLKVFYTSHRIYVFDCILWRQLYGGQQSQPHFQFWLFLILN